MDRTESADRHHSNPQTGSGAEPTAAYLALCDTPPVLLCEAARAAKGVVVMLRMGRMPGAAERYCGTRKLAFTMHKILDDRRHIGMDRSAPEAEAHGRILGAFRSLLDGAREAPQDKGEYTEFTVPGRLWKNLADTLVTPDCAGFLPGEPRFMEIRQQLYEAQGVPLPAPNSSFAAPRRPEPVEDRMPGSSPID